LIRHIPNILTSIRIILIPFFVTYLINGKADFAIIIFCFASFTDFLDGFIARKYNVVTKFGIFFDPLADKLLTTSAFIGFMFLDLFASQINWVMVSIIFTRDIIITILRIIMDMIGISMVTSKLGKLKTFLQMSVIFYMLIILYMSMEEIALYQFFINSNSIYYLMFTTSLVTAYTGLYYLYFNRHVIISRVNK
tara:strand:- start:190 stop:771 length:582 start_codon:yes stop_codon:yes gene_type:complete